MIPYILAAIGGYLIAQSSKEKFAYGGQIEYGVRVSGKDPQTGARFNYVYDIEANSDEEAMAQAKKRFIEDFGLDGVAEITMSEEIYFENGGEIKFTFKTDEEYQYAKRGSYFDYEGADMTVLDEKGRKLFFQPKSEQEYKKIKEKYKVIKESPAELYWDIQDYADPEDREEREDNYDPYDELYSKGGKVKFEDKVTSISKRLVGTKVPKRLEKDYGKKYSRSEAEMAGRRIAGAQLKKYGKK